MAQVTPRTTLPADSDTTGAVQITGASLRCSVRATALTTLALIRMDPSGVWFRISDETGAQMQFTAQPGGDAGNTDVSFSLPAVSSNEWYNLIADSTFAGYAEIDSLSAPPGPSGSVPTSRVLTPANGILFDGASSAVDLSADRTVGIGNISRTKEANYTDTVATSTTAATAGGNLAVSAGTGATTGAGGTYSGKGGIGGNDAVGGPAQIAGGAAGGGNRAGGAASLTGGLGAGTAAGGAASVAGGVGGSTGAGGAASLAGGAAGGAAAAGGAVSIVGGLGNTTGAGGAIVAAGGAGGNDAVGGLVSLTGGAAGGGNRAGGAATKTGGAGAGSAAGGAVTSIGGVGGATGAGGLAALVGGAGGATSGTGGAAAIAGGAGSNGNADGGAVTINGGAKNGSGADGLISLGVTSGSFVKYGVKVQATAAAWTIADPGNAGAIVVTASGVCMLTSAGAETRTVAIPTFVGQTLDIIVDTYVGDIVITFSQRINAALNTIGTFGVVGDYLGLVGVTIGGALRWQVRSNDGVALS